MLEGELLVPSSTSAAVSTVTVFMVRVYLLLARLPLSPYGSLCAHLTFVLLAGA